MSAGPLLCREKAIKKRNEWWPRRDLLRAVVGWVAMGCPPAGRGAVLADLDERALPEVVGQRKAL
jgi:hypothetical protein